MKQLIFLTICIFLITFFACTKDPAPPAPPPPAEEKPIIELGRMSMVKEGKTWSYPARAYYYNTGKRQVIIDYKLIKNSLEEHFYISDLPNKIGKYKMERDISINGHNSIPEVHISWILDVDQYIGSMDVDTSGGQGNWLEVIRYDSIQKIYEGRFEMHLERTSGASIGVPAKMHVTDGKFHVQIKQ